MVESAKHQSPGSEWMLLELVADGVLVVNEAGAIVYANQRVERLLGYGLMELLGRPVEMLVEGHLRDPHSSQRTGFHDSPHIREMGSGLHIRGLHKDGSLVPLDIHLQPLHTTGLVVASLRRRDVPSSWTADWDILARREREARAMLDIVVQRLYGIFLSLRAHQNDESTEDSDHESRTALIDETIDMIRTSFLEPAGPDWTMARTQANLVTTDDRADAADTADAS